MNTQGQHLRVCLVAPMPPPYGGVANWTRLVTEHATHDGRVEIHIINTASPQRLADGRGWFDRIVRQGLRMVGITWHLHRLIRKAAPDVVHLTTAGQLGLIRDRLLLAMARHHGIPTAYHLHFGRIPEVARRNGLEWRALVRTLRSASLVIALDEKTEETVRPVVSSGCVTRIPNPVNLASLPHPNGCSSNRIVFLGWVTPSKGIEDLLIAWSRLHTEHPDWDLVIVGPYDSHYMDFLVGRFDLAGVTFTGELPHAEALKTLSEAGILVLPSHTEAFPYAVLEAMALAKPVVATWVGAIPEMLDDNCGILVAPRDPRDLARGIETIIREDDRRCRMGSLAKQRASRIYGIDVVFERYLARWVALGGAKVTG